MNGPRIRSRARLVAHAFAGFALAATGCDRTVAGSGSGSPDATMRFVSGVHGAVNVLVDGVSVLGGVTLGGAIDAPVAAGSHTIVVQKVGGASGAARTVSFAIGRSVIVVAVDSSGVPSPSVLSDTNAVVPSGVTKLRVAHYAQNAPTIDIWRTQPDYTTPIRVMFPFNYQAVSPYLQSTPGTWQVMVSHPVQTVNGPMPDTLATSGAIAILAGFSRTAIVVDGATAGSVQIVVLDP